MLCKTSKTGCTKLKTNVSYTVGKELNVDSENIGVCYVETSSSCEKMTLLPKKWLIFTKVILKMKKWHKRKSKIFITSTIVGSELN